MPGDPRASNEAAQTVYAAAVNNGGSLDNIQPGLDFMKKLTTSGNLLPLIADPGVIAKGETPISIHWNYLALADQQSDNGNPSIQVVYPTGTAWVVTTTRPSALMPRTPLPPACGKSIYTLTKARTPSSKVSAPRPAWLTCCHAVWCLLLHKLRSRPLPCCPLP